ncbi:NHLP leader peptide family RiPP precursor [Tenacibaculum ovolyticum]|uniref:NHLP leader peptide family RiPP precursor n=1 Tax=Tenacibaculum ovolyticum TaxID=104270 RepID=UPI0022F3982E|nr:NHLP leader peptide family RiPP precursor [Tenacibaculum ovolyticum]WBX76790.1 NHLP leader peptide family RiPP precursor [Tenacibaculum ovolyticum]
MEITREQQLLQQVVNEAWENADFKKKLINNPLEAIEALTGEKLNVPEGKTLVVRDQTSEETVYINIPAEQKLEDVELNEEQLDAVAGGAIDGPNGCILPNPFDDIIKTFLPK